MRGGKKLFLGFTPIWNVKGENMRINPILPSYRVNYTLKSTPCKKSINNINCPRKFRDKERERNFGVATLKGEHLYGDDESAAKCDTGLDYN